MRLVQVAKALGMTGQQLRKELLQVNFGIKPTDREIPDGLAQGVIRFVAQKHGITVDQAALSAGAFLEDDDEGGDSHDAPADTTGAPAAQAGAGLAQTSVAPAAAVKSAAEVPHAADLNVLRKLTLTDVSKEAIARQQQRNAQQRSAGSHDRRPRRPEDRPKPEKRRITEGTQQQIKKKEGVVLLAAHVTVKEFAEKTGIQVPIVISTLLKNGVMATVNQTIDFDTAAIIAADLEVDVRREQAAASAEQLIAKNLKDLLQDEPENLVPRPPIVVVMGHVDHGKTSLLDAIRQTDVAGGEAGGITQHIGASQVHYTSKGADTPSIITFLDTPGHEAFTAMRARGAQVTDIAIIVVSAEEGVKPTTVEAVNHAKEAGVPIIVAITKIDKPQADIERVKGEVAGLGLQPEDWGGTVPFVPCSAVSKQGVDTILDTILLLAEIASLRGNPARSGIATVIESQLDSSLGPLATVVVNTGTLRLSDVFVCGVTNGRVRTMVDGHGQRQTAVLPSGAVRVSGFSAVPQTGDILQVVGSEKEAKELVEKLLEHATSRRKRSFADLVSRLSEGKLQQLKVVLKADAQGSLEALQEALQKCSTDVTAVKVIHAAIGAVSESDVMMAAASEGVVLAFHVNVPGDVTRTAEREGISVRTYDVVYALLDDVAALLTGMLQPEEAEEVLGHLEVKQVFFRKRSEQVVGGKVSDGIIKRLPFRLLRGDVLTDTGRITSLRHVEKDVKEVKEGAECGMRIDCATPIEPGDVLEVFLREIKRKAPGA